MAAAVARAVVQRTLVPPDTRTTPSAFQIGLAESLRRLQGCREDLARHRELLHQLNRGAAQRRGMGSASCGLPCVVRFEALTRRPEITPEQVKQAFRLLAKKCHPDHGGDPVLFARLYQAYEVAFGA